MSQFNWEELAKPLIQMNLPIRHEPYQYHNGIDTNKFQSIYLEKFFTGKEHQPREVVIITLIHNDNTETQIDLSMEFLDRFVKALQLLQIAIY